MEETSTFTTLKSITAYRKKQSCHPSCIFGKDHDKYVRMVEGLGDNLLQQQVAEILGDLLFASNLALNKTQESEDLKDRMANLEEDLATRTKIFTNRETALYLELASLHQSKNDAKALQDKGLEVVELEARILPIRIRAVELEDLVAELKGKV